MHWRVILSLCGNAFLSTVAALDANGPTVVPGAYIVEFADDHVSIPSNIRSKPHSKILGYKFFPSELWINKRDDS